MAQLRGLAVLADDNKLHFVPVVAMQSMDNKVHTANRAACLLSALLLVLTGNTSSTLICLQAPCLCEGWQYCRRVRLYLQRLLCARVFCVF